MLGALKRIVVPSGRGLGQWRVEAQAAGLRFVSTAISKATFAVPPLGGGLPWSEGPKYWADAI